MTKNVGAIDQIIRIIIALIIGGLGYYYQTWWGLLALAPLVTAFFRYCPAWTILGFSTKRVNKAS